MATMKHRRTDTTPGSANDRESKMNATQNMEIIFFVVVSAACAALFALTPTPTITVNVSGPILVPQATIETITVTGKRIS